MQLEILYKELPENVCFIYTTICNKKYGIINSHASNRDKYLYQQACRYSYESNSEDKIICKDSKYSDEKICAFLEYLHQKSNLKKSFLLLNKAELQAIRDDKLA
jgi:hypothetical protein